MCGEQLDGMQGILLVNVTMIFVMLFLCGALINEDWLLDYQKLITFPNLCVAPSDFQSTRIVEDA